MNNYLRYVVEAKDQDGWFDYAFTTTKSEALHIASDLKESFGENIKVIDRQNMLQIN